MSTPSTTGSFAKYILVFAPAMSALAYFGWSVDPVIASVGAITTLVVYALLLPGRSRIEIPDEETRIEQVFGASYVDAMRRSQAIVEFDKDGKIITANDKFLSLLGYSLSDLQGLKHSSFIEPETANGSAYRALWEKISSGASGSEELEGVRSDGTPLWFQASFCPIVDDGETVRIIAAIIDVTEKSRAFAANQSEVESLRQSQACVEYDKDGTVISANEKFLSILGYTLEEVQGKNHRIFVEPSFASSREYGEFWDQLRLGDFEFKEFKYVNKEGSAVGLQDSYNPILESGEVIKVVQYATDVTAQNSAVIELGGIVEAIDKSQATIEFELDGTIISANDNFLDAMGYSLDEIVGKHHRLFVEPHTAASEEYRNFWDKLKRGEYQSAEYKRLGKGGKEIWIQASYNPVYGSNGEPVKVVKFATDVTERKLRDANFTGQIEAISQSQAVIEFELNGTIISANENFLATVGYRLDEIQGQHHRMFVDSDYAASSEYRDFWEKLARGEYHSGQFKRVHKNGSDVWIEASYNPILDMNGKPYKVVKYASDITAQKAAEHESRTVRRAIGTVSSNVVVADKDFNIIYMNPTAEELFRDGESEIRTVLPKFNASTLIGTNIDEFHKDPSHQRRMIDGLTSPFVSQLTFGTKIYKIVASPLFEDGVRVGAVLEWYDRTQENGIEREVADVVQSALAGDLSKRIEMAGKQGFFESLSKGVNQLVGISERVIEDTIRVLSAIAEGNLNETISSDYEGSYEKLKQDANSTVAKLTEVVGGIQSSASSVKTGADEISQGNTNLSQRTEEQASSLEETASSMEEMTSTVRQNADNAGQANQLAKAAREQAEKGGNVVSQAVKAMDEINASSKKISDIIGVIDEIAFQTNLLALNASVEAARAGDQGRGFAVVASEVRNLAGRSATAAKEIKDLIEDSGAKVDQGSRLVNESGDTLQEIVTGVKKVTDIVGEIAAASQEQSAGIDEVNKAITQMDELTQQNAALVEEAAAASESLGEQADDLNQMMQFFSVNGSESSSGQAPNFSGVERRSSERPWSPQSAAQTPSAPVAQPVSATTQRAASGGGDLEWEEF